MARVSSPSGCKSLKTLPISSRIKTNFLEDLLPCTRRTISFHRVQNLRCNSGRVSLTVTSNLEIDRRVPLNWSCSSKNRRVVQIKLARNRLFPCFRSPLLISDSSEIASAIQVSSCFLTLAMIRAIIQLPMTAIRRSVLLRQRLRIYHIAGEGGTSFQFSLLIIRSVIFLPTRSPSTLWVAFMHVRSRRLLVDSEIESDDSVRSKN
jgi:hypothetical protein